MGDTKAGTDTSATAWTPLPVRLDPGSDLRRALQAVLAGHGCHAGFVVAGIGSLDTASLRLAGADSPVQLAGDLEILTVSGTLSPDGPHLHLSVADATGRVVGGHAGEGCRVRTTAEVLVALLPDWRFAREVDPATGYRELTVTRRPGTRAAGD